jgi:hypothetical protein
MAEATYTLYRGVVSATTSTVLFTAPTDVAVRIDNIVVTNATTASRTYTISLANVDIANAVSIPANTTQYIDLSQVIYSGETIKGGASAASSVAFHIAGSDAI